jgi:hypothetical protein
MNRYRLRFSVRLLLLFVGILAVLFAVGGKRVADARKQRQLISLIQSYGGENHHELNFTDAQERTIRFPNMDFSPSLPGPQWLRRRLGDEYFVSVTEAFWDKASHRVLDDAMFAEFADTLRSQGLTCPPGLVFSELPITDLTLKKLATFPHVASLHIVNCPGVTDAGMVHLQSLKHLRRLDLSGSSVTDEGMVHLSGLSKLRELSLRRTSVSDAGLSHFTGLKDLEWLWLSSTAATSDGVNDLRKHLPACEIAW